MRVILKCMSPVSHGAFGESAGNAVPCRRLRIVNLPSRPRVPCLSGNSLRGQLRRIVMRDLLDRAGLSRDTLPGPKWDRLYAALANGGHLEGEGSSTTKPDQVRALRESLPPLSVFGAALYSWMLPGHMDVGWLYPRCRETFAAGLVSEGFDVPAEDLVEEVSLCRHIDREEQDPEASGVTPMPTTMECLMPGTVLESVITFARHASAIEQAVIAYGLNRLRALGGKSGSGFGVVQIEGLGVDEQPYLDWLNATPDLADRLRHLADTLARKPGKPEKAKEETP